MQVTVLDCDTLRIKVIYIAICKDRLLSYKTISLIKTFYSLLLLHNMCQKLNKTVKILVDFSDNKKDE